MRKLIYLGLVSLSTVAYSQTDAPTPPKPDEKRFALKNPDFKIEPYM
jgi:hypothetical protein